MDLMDAFGSSYLRRISPSNPQNTKFQNQRAVLAHLHTLGFLSVSDLAVLLGLSKTTISKIIQSLLDADIVQAMGKGATTASGGKKPELFRFNGSCRYVIVTYAHFDYIEVAVLNFDSEILYRYSDPTNTFSSYEEAVSQSVRLYERALKEYPIEPNQLYNFTLLGTGIINSTEGILRLSPGRTWPTELRVLEDISRQLIVNPETMNFFNSHAALGYAELLSLANFSLEKIVLIHAGNRCGGSIIQDHTLLRGSNGFIGELGHIILDPRSEVQCACGNHGCFEALIKKETLLANACRDSHNYPHSPIHSKVLLGDLTTDDIFEAFIDRDPFAVLLLGDIAGWFAHLIHNITITHDPDKFIIQGFYTQAGPEFLNMIRMKLVNTAFFNISRDIEVEAARYPAADATFMGAAHHALHRFIDTGDLSVFE